MGIALLRVVRPIDGAGRVLDIGCSARVLPARREEQAGRRRV